MLEQLSYNKALIDGFSDKECKGRKLGYYIKLLA